MSRQKSDFGISIAEGTQRNQDVACSTISSNVENEPNMEMESPSA